MNDVAIKSIDLVMNAKDGKAVVLCVDGMDGAGKSTFVDEAFTHFQERGLKVYVEHFPRYTTHMGKAIRDLLDNPNQIAVERPDIMQRLYVADQLLFEQRELEQLKQDYDVIILDRHMFSTMAYAMACGTPFPEVRKWQGDMKFPDFTFFFTIDTEVLASRRAGTKMDVFESKRQFIDKIRTGYEMIVPGLKKQGIRLPHAYVDANKSKDEVFGSC